MKKVLLIMTLVSFALSARSTPLAGIYMFCRVIGGDTLYFTTLDEVEVSALRVFKSKKEERAYRQYVATYTRLVYNIKKAYPFAVATREQLAILNAHYVKLKTNRERKAYTKQVEENLRAQFEDDLKKLSFRQGLILLKLIDRETNNNAYQLIKDFRGGLTATFFQTFAPLFKINLKTEYDPLGEDKMIEEIVLKVEQGLL